MHIAGPGRWPAARRRCRGRCARGRAPTAAAAGRSPGSAASGGPARSWPPSCRPSTTGVALQQHALERDDEVEDLEGGPVFQNCLRKKLHPAVIAELLVGRSPRLPRPWWSRPLPADVCSMFARMHRHYPAVSGIASGRRCARWPGWRARRRPARGCPAGVLWMGGGHGRFGANAAPCYARPMV